MEIKKEVRMLVGIYFEVNPNMNKGIAFKSKAFDIIFAYRTKHKKTYKEIKECIESNPMDSRPIWTAFYDYFYKNKKEENKKELPYIDAIDKSLNPDDWL